MCHFAHDKVVTYSRFKQKRTVLRFFRIFSRGLFGFGSKVCIANIC
jgi:hypothetical protein